MTIEEEAKQKFELGPAFHFTLIENLADILSEGGLLSKALVQHRLKGDLSHPEIQEARRTKIVPGTGRSVHEFVPLYFGFKTPMLALRQDRNEDILYFRFPLDVLGLPGAMFSDGNARDGMTKFFPFETVDSLAVLDVAAINTVKWRKDEEKKRRKQAEILIPDRLDLKYLKDIWCFSEGARQRAKNVLQDFGRSTAVFVRPGFSFQGAKP